MSPVSVPDPGQPPLKSAPSQAPSGRAAPSDADSATEVAALAALLAEVVQLAGQRAVFPSRWALIAELALEHDSVRAALQAEVASAPVGAEAPPLSTGHIIAEPRSLRDQIGDGCVRC